jgi:DNA-binding transcriptional LysR family regulator
MLESRRLRHFLTVFELGSIGQAAEKLLLTQPALSKSIRQLEDELGVRLFDRTTVGVVPTVFGKALAMHAKTIEQQVRQAEAAISSLKGKAKGIVSVGVGPSVAAGLMPAATIMLHKLQPEIELNVVQGLVDELIPALRRGELDVAIGAWPLVSDPAFSTEVLLRDRIEVVAREGHPLAGGVATLTDLLTHPWALPPATQRWRQTLDELFYAQGLSPPRPIVTSNSAAYLAALMRKSDCLSFLPRQTVVGEAGLTTIEVEDLPAFEPDISMTYRERSLNNPAKMEVIQVLRAVAGESGREELAAAEAA